MPDTAPEARHLLRVLSRALQDVHRALIDFSRERYELANGPVRSKGELLELLLRDEAFAWLRPLSGMIVEIDELAAREPPPDETELGAVRARVESFVTSSANPDAFGSRYIALLASEPKVAMDHGALRAALRALPAPTSARKPLRSDAFRAAVEAGDLDAVVAQLAPGVVLHSPVTFKPFEGRDAVAFLFSILLRTFEDFRYEDEFEAADGSAVLHFTARVADRTVEGIDMLRFDASGAIVDFTVMVRPLSAVLALRDAVGSQLG